MPLQTVLVLVLGLGAGAGCVTINVAPGWEETDSGASGAGTTGDDAPSAGGSTAGQTAFQSSFYAFAVPNCGACHAGGQTPNFALSNVAAAYQNAIPYANFADPSSSALVVYAGNSHCGVSSCANNSPAALQAVTTWAAAENGGADSGAPSRGSSGGEAGGGTGEAGGTGGGGASGTCPAVVPTQGATCTGDSTCTYGVNACACIGGTWQCN